MLKPGLRTVWRDSVTLQVGLEPDRAVVLTGVQPGDARLIASLDGTRELTEVIADAVALGLDELRASRLLRLLREGGVLADAGEPAGRWAALDPLERDRLDPDLTSLALLQPGDGDALAAFERRAGAAVLVDGAGRVGAAVATLLAAAGVGHVAVRDEGRMAVADAAPAGGPPSAAGILRADAARAAMRQAAPSVVPTLPRQRRRPDIVVLAPAAAPALETADRWLRADVAHLAVGVFETTGIVGPFVVPGHSSCLRCAALHRTDRDPAWPVVAAQLATAAPRAACDVALATLVASLAAMHVLSLLDGHGLPPSVDGTLETRLPEGITRRRRWSVHPACGCSWPRAG